MIVSNRRPVGALGSRLLLQALDQYVEVPHRAQPPGEDPQPGNDLVLAH